MGCWYLSTKVQQDPTGEDGGDAQAAAPGVCGEAEPASFHLPAAESKGLTEEKIYFLMTSEPSPCAACVLPASCEHSKLVCKYWLEAAGGKKTRRSRLFVRDSEGPRALALLPLGKGLSQGPPRRPSTEAVSKDSARVLLALFMDVLSGKPISSLILFSLDAVLTRASSEPLRWPSPSASKSLNRDSTRRRFWEAGSRRLAPSGRGCRRVCSARRTFFRRA